MNSVVNNLVRCSSKINLDFSVSSWNGRGVSLEVVKLCLNSAMVKGLDSDLVMVKDKRKLEDNESNR